jgi:DNA-binding NtrC family response regulator
MLVRTLIGVSTEALAERIEGLLDRRDTVVIRAGSSPEFPRLLEAEEIDLVVAEEAWVAEDLEPWVTRIRALPDCPDLILVTGREDPRRRAALLAAGCLAVLNVQVSDRELRQTLRTLVNRLAQDVVTRLTARRLERKEAGFNAIVSESGSMSAVLSVARQVAAADSSVLILGETGVGKELLARSIHLQSARSGGPFVPVNCGAIPEGLLESELFGHEQGAFTGATRARRGHFEMAHRGTLFLDEVGELPLHLQVKLLRVLEDHRIQRLGSEKSERVDVRIVASTNRDLEGDVGEHRFRADLYYRLAVVTLLIPPLRERKEDVTKLAAHYLDHFGKVLGRSGVRISDEAMEALVRHEWPGNVRELINVIERAVLLCRSPEIQLADLPPAVQRRTGPRLVGPTDPRPIREARRRAVAAFELEYLSDLLRRTGGRVGETARLAGIRERSLYDLMRARGLRKEDFRD